jgi:uncharacterized membrane protein YidH (DUF202 family)
MSETLGEFGQFDFDKAVGPNGYVSYATIGATIGTIIPGIGTLVGLVVGGIADLVMSARQAKEQRKQMKKDFYIKLLKRYNTQIFISTLERLGPAMVYLQTLGLKPGSPEYDEALKKKLYSEVGYKGNCAVDIFGPAPPGSKRPAICSIDNKGKMTAYSQHIDTALGPKWAEACRALHKAALQEWANEQRENILFKRDITKEKSDAKRKTITKLLVNGGMILGMLGYSIRQKKKLKFMRAYKSQQKLAVKPK